MEEKADKIYALNLKRKYLMHLKNSQPFNKALRIYQEKKEAHLLRQTFAVWIYRYRESEFQRIRKRIMAETWYRHLLMMKMFDKWSVAYARRRKLLKQSKSNPSTPTSSLRNITISSSEKKKRVQFREPLEG